MSYYRLKNGRFITKKASMKGIKCLKMMSEAKKKLMPNMIIESVENKVLEGRRVIDLREFAKNLRCRICGKPLDLLKITHERIMGFHSVLTVTCDICKESTLVHTGKINKNKAGNNTAMIHGAIHSGAGSTALNKILACGNFPAISNDLYKRYEKIVGEAIEKEAKSSCQRAASEERDLVIKNLEKLCEQL